MLSILVIENAKHSGHRECLAFWSVRMLSILVSENAKHSGLQKAGNFAFKLKNFCNCAYMRPEKKSILSKNTKLNAKFPKISSPECLAFSQTRMLSILPCKNAKHSAQFIGLKKKKKI